MPELSSYVVAPMTLADVDQVLEIEQASFSAPWSARAFRYEIAENEHSVMLVVRPAPRTSFRWVQWLRRHKLLSPGPALGYAGSWLLVDDIHISTIAVHPQWRGRGLGELLLVSLLEKGIELEAQRATLEVRVSNLAAQGLYGKYGFEIVSRRKGYYADNNEDAYIMVTPSFKSPEFQATLYRNLGALGKRL